MHPVEIWSPSRALRTSSDQARCPWISAFFPRGDDRALPWWFIAHSPGMFQFESRRPHNVSREAILLSVDLQENRIVREYGVVPLIIGDDFIPYPAEEP